MVLSFMTHLIYYNSPGFCCSFGSILLNVWPALNLKCVLRFDKEHEDMLYGVTVCTNQLTLFQCFERRFVKVMKFIIPSALLSYIKVKVAFFENTSKKLKRPSI